MLPAGRAGSPWLARSRARTAVALPAFVQASRARPRTRTRDSGNVSLLGPHKSQAGLNASVLRDFARAGAFSISQSPRTASPWRHRPGARGAAPWRCPLAAVAARRRPAPSGKPPARSSDRPVPRERFGRAETARPGSGLARSRVSGSRRGISCEGRGG